MSDAFPPGFFDRIREEMGVAEGRSTGVQQGRGVKRYLLWRHQCGARSWKDAEGAFPNFCPGCRCDTKRDEYDWTTVVGAVSPEPREDCDARIGERRCRLEKGHEGYHDMPREGEQEAREPYLVGCPVDRCVLEDGHAGRHCMGTGEEFTVHEGVVVAVDRGPEPKVEADRENPSIHHVASVLRLTASRLRDPEYRWSVDPAAVLERLAEKLEKEG